jgi:hypothetical protein
MFRCKNKILTEENLENAYKIFVWKYIFRWWRNELYSTWVRLAQSVQRLATNWTIRGSNPGGGEIFRNIPDWPWGPPILLYSGYQVFFPRVKRPERGFDHPPPSSADVKGRVELYLYSPSGPSWSVLGWILHLPFPLQQRCNESKYHLLLLWM